ncbi:MAG: hypothetical protein E6G14_12325 [Actinobacteria bacterium]|nr:MAG: hypothetical protein E6G14_12325 [Actinomycetota bacterium]
MEEAVELAATGDARDRGASAADDELERFAVGGGFRMPAEPKLQNPAQRVDHVRPSFFTVPHRVFVKAAGVLRPGGRLALADMAAVKQR